MILSYKNKFIFIKSQKTGGTSLEVALSNFCGDKDIITPIFPKSNEDLRKNFGFRGPQNYKTNAEVLVNNKIVKFEFFNHLPISVLKKIIPEEIFNRYYKFTIVRNPFDQILSFYYWKVRGKLNTISFSNFCEQNAKNFFQNEKKLISINNDLPYNKIIKYENLQNDITYLDEKLNFNNELISIFQKIKLKSEYRTNKNYEKICNLSKKIIIQEAYFFFKNFDYSEKIPNEI